KLPYLARWEIEGGPTHELRHCLCQTTLAVDVSFLGGAAPGACGPDGDLLAHLLAERKQDLLDRWTRRVLDGRRGDGTGGEPEHRHDIALFIDGLIATLLDDGVDSRRLRQLTREPARGERVTIVTRTLRTTLGEWADFRAALIDLCDHAAVVLDAGRMRLVHRAIDEAAVRSATALGEATSSA
ncbi:MAG TPA: hypothetical protein VLT33_15525, partial [Labilithrix sp.]|nr:hypothetical protein [Labilithrix sp.]